MTQATQLLTTLDAARLADVSPATIRQWRRSGRLVPAVRAANGLSLFSQADVERFIAERMGRREPHETAAVASAQ